MESVPAEAEGQGLAPGLGLGPLLQSMDPGMESQTQMVVFIPV